MNKLICAFDTKRNVYIDPDKIQSINFNDGIVVSITLWEEYSENPKVIAFRCIDSSDLILYEMKAMAWTPQ